MPYEKSDIGGEGEKGLFTRRFSCKTFCPVPVPKEFGMKSSKAGDEPK